STHLYFKHGPPARPIDCWICFDENREPMTINEYYYLNPAHPEVKKYLKKMIRHFTENYDVDGIHFDRIRYPGLNYVFDPISIARYQADSLRNPISRADWGRQTLTDLVEDVVAEALLVKPYLHISAATWGMYRTDDIPGYERFGSGFANYYQDAIDWLNRGIMDFIVPMIYWDIEDPKPNFHELWTDFQRRTPHFRYIFPGIRLRERYIRDGQTISQVNFIRLNQGFGHVYFSYSDLERDKTGILKKFLYSRPALLPAGLKRTDPEQIMALRFHKIFPEDYAGRYVRPVEHPGLKYTDAEGWIGLINREQPSVLSINQIALNTRGWFAPYRYVVEKDSTVSREMPWLEYRRFPGDTVTQSKFHLLAKTEYPAQTYINGDSVELYKTGVFWKTIQLDKGINRIRASVFTEDSTGISYERELHYIPAEPREPLPLWIDSSSVDLPSEMILLPADEIPLTFNGSKGQNAWVIIQPGDLKIRMHRQDFWDYSRYETVLSLRKLKMEKKYTVSILLEPVTKNGDDKLKFSLNTFIWVRDFDKYPLVKTVRPDAVFTYNLGRIRLGGPIIAELPEDVILRTNGKVGPFYRIFLNPVESGFIHEESLEILPAEMVPPGYYLQSISVNSTENSDILVIPYPEKVPYAIYPEPDQKRIKISLYGVKTSSTWLIHHQDLRIIEKVTWQQVTPETYQLIINLKTSKIWGYECKPADGSLIFRLKYPPDVKLSDSLNLSGLKVAIEAGHGGSNIGAVGLSGLLEKEINLDVALKLEEICKAHGVEVLQIRPADVDMDLTTKRKTAENSDADILVSIHANSGSTRNGFETVGGASTYYHNSFWADFADIIMKNLLELDLNDFGTVGSFNYKVIRVNSRPTILVEQAFMSHAADEEKLASEEFRQQMAQKIFEGISDYVKFMLEEK
ncbi:MAG: N-acetylmuramoyl-L-alanine amidase, partial [Calditrichaeota bacterium]|nr:N-acetylmuramoyl-L-alanine amidase [Calditrichota bacterium]